MKYTLTLIDTPIGRIKVVTDNAALHKVEWLDSVDSNIDTTRVNETSKHIAGQIEAYFLDANIDWSVELAKVGTEFQRRVWKYLQTIPTGETRTYSEVAAELSTSARAVGNACRANPYVIITPCHRVVSKTGIGGYSGQIEGNNIAIKQWLLAHERD